MGIFSALCTKNVKIVRKITAWQILAAWLPGTEQTEPNTALSATTESPRVWVYGIICGCLSPMLSLAPWVNLLWPSAVGEPAGADLPHSEWVVVSEWAAANLSECEPTVWEPAVTKPSGKLSELAISRFRCRLGVRGRIPGKNTLMVHGEIS